MANPIVTALPNYVEEHRLPLIAKSVLRGKTIELVQIETGVKSDTALNLISASVTFGDGSSCGWTPTEGVTLSQRKLVPVFIKVNQAFCDKNLLKKWASYEVTLAAGRSTLPFEEQFLEEISNSINEQIEKMVWQGDSANGASRVECDGYLKHIEASGSGATILTDTDGTTAYNRIKEVYNALPARVVDKQDTVIFVSNSLYRDFINELVASNLYHFNPDYGQGEYPLPGTSIRVIAVSGLDGTNKIVAGRLSNFFYGVDAEDDKDTLDLWYSKDNQEFRLAANFAVSTQVAYPDEIVLSKIS